MTDVDPMEFSNRVGAELAYYLGERSRAELQGLSQEAQFSAALGASLLCVADVLRVPVEQGAPPAKIAAICARQLEGLLSVIAEAKAPPPSGDAS